MQFTCTRKFFEIAYVPKQHFNNLECKGDPRARCGARHAPPPAWHTKQARQDFNAAHFKPLAVHDSAHTRLRPHVNVELLTHDVNSALPLRKFL